MIYCVPPKSGTRALPHPLANTDRTLLTKHCIPLMHSSTLNSKSQGKHWLCKYITIETHCMSIDPQSIYIIIIYM